MQPDMVITVFNATFTLLWVLRGAVPVMQKPTHNSQGAFRDFK